MDLYFSPLACSMATRIAFYEAGIDGNFIAVDNAIPVGSLAAQLKVLG